MKKIFLLAIIIALLNSYQSKAQIYQQQAPMWCWAACIQSALGQANVNQTQAQIVSRLTGWPQNVPANSGQVIAILNSYNFKAWSVGYPANPQQLYNTLTSGWKLIAFVNPSNNPQVGHFIMLQGISPNGFVIVSDPANGMTYEQTAQNLYYAWNWSSSIVVGTPN
jgi:ABC-type bacteriocin/lantibiotic exporter with double-glycine peptidase domain